MRRGSTVLLFVIATVIAAAACHEEGDIQVASLDFTGNGAFDARQLSAVLVTRASGWLPWSEKHYFDRREFENDLIRLSSFYRERGYSHARVSSVDVNLSAGQTSVRLLIQIDEGTPTLVDRVTFAGFDALPDHANRELETLALRAGEPADRVRLSAMRDGAAHLLRENGYAAAKVDITEEPGAEPDHVRLRVSARPGAKTYFGPVEVAGLKKVKRDVVDRSMAYAPGDLYRESLVLQSQRQLSALEVFDFANLHTGAASAGPLPTVVTVTESSPQRFEFGAGYGTDDRLRGSFEWRHVNAFGRADQLNATAKWARTIQGTSFGYARQNFLGRSASFEARGSAWWAHAPSYDSQSYGGRATLHYVFDVNDAPRRHDDRRMDVQFGYANEYLRYGVTPQALADLSGFAERIALGLDPVTGRGSGTQAGISAQLKRTVLDDASNPRRGRVFSIRLDHVAPWLGGTFRFDEVGSEARVYQSIGPFVIAGRLDYATLAASDPLKVPFSARYFLGGSNSLRGWGRFEVAPLTSGGLPLGGRSSLTISGEVRFPIRGAIGGAFFVDAGNVWAGDWELHGGDLRYTVGPGIRFATPLGVIRADVGFQLNPIANLRINGTPETRHWRIQFSIGQAF